MDFGLGASTGDLRSYDQSLLKQCRSVSEFDDHSALDGTNNNNSRKVSRTDSYFSCRQQQPTSNDSSSPDENPITAQLGSNDQHLMMSSSAGGYLNQVSAAAMRQLAYQQQQQLYPYKQTQGHFGAMGQQYYPFTASQWAELEHQALIFKYMMARVPVPPELLNPIRRSVAAAAIGPHNLIPSCNIGGSWGGFQLGVSGSPLDAEPGRCRRTDGKKWRCSRPVVPEQKYCERHIHRGRDRSKKAQEAAAAAAQSRAGAGLLNSTTSNPAFQGNNNSNGGDVSIGGKMLAASSMPGMAVSIAAASQSNKDQRFLNAMSKAHSDLRPEQLLFSEVSGSTRELAPMQAHHPSGNCNKLQSSAGTTIRMIPITTTTTTGNSSMQQHFGDHQSIQQQQYKSMMGTYDSSGKSMQQLGMFAPEPQQQQQQQVSPLIRGVERKPEALRHFFDDWPPGESKAQSCALSWSDDMDDSHAKLNSSSNTQLSGSRNSSEYARAESESAIFSPLKLGLEDTTTNSAANEVELNEDENEEGGLSNVRHGAPWSANTNFSGSTGGPLAEALQKHSSNAARATRIGFNLLGGERRNLQHQNGSSHQVAAASPTGVLQKMACFSDCSSSASSPGSVKTEANNPHSAMI